MANVNPDSRKRLTTHTDVYVGKTTIGVNPMRVEDVIALMDEPTASDRALITRAFNFSQKAHEGHRRKSGEPYFVHVFETAKLLAETGMGPQTISAGLLHDTVEDVGTTRKEIEEAFGPDILRLVEGVTKLGALKYRGIKQHAESLRKLFVATSEDIRVVIIKLADRLHNMRTLEHVPKAKQKRIALETLEIYARVADRLGMGRLRGELEDLSFPYIYPNEYEEVTKMLKQKSRENETHLEKVSRSLKKELAKQGITDFSMESRIKRRYSLFTKLKRKDWDIDKVYDLSALRIIVPKIADCYRVLGVIHGAWRPLPGRIKDYIAFPKPNGYRSIHTTIFTGDGGIVEIQIRTPMMHREAEYGVAAHVSYKHLFDTGDTKSAGLSWIRALLPKKPLPNNVLTQKNGTSKGSAKQQTKDKYHRPEVPQWIKQIAETQEGNESQEFLDRLRGDFFTHRVFVFTPKGDVIDLPVDSSPIDFAYAIHSDVGNHMASTKVNGKMVSFDTKLKNGDIVEVATKPSSKPSQKWLEFATTTLAQRKIRQALQKKE